MQLRQDELRPLQRMPCPTRSLPPSPSKTLEVNEYTSWAWEEFLPLTCQQVLRCPWRTANYNSCLPLDMGRIPQWLLFLNNFHPVTSTGSVWMETDTSPKSFLPQCCKDYRCTTTPVTWLRFRCQVCYWQFQCLCSQEYSRWTPCASFRDSWLQRKSTASSPVAFHAELDTDDSHP